MQVEKILAGYRETVEDQIFELIGYVVKNRRCLNLGDVRLRCEHLVREIAQYERMVKEVEAILQKRREVDNDGQREVAAN